MGLLINAIKSLFVNPWNAYFLAKLCQHQDTQICKYAKSFHKEHSTPPIAMDIESTTVASKTILDLLDEKLVAEHKALQAKFSMLTQQIHSCQKTSHPGAHPSTQAKNTTGTPAKNKMDTSTSKHTNNTRNNNNTKNDKKTQKQNQAHERPIFFQWSKPPLLANSKKVSQQSNKWPCSHQCHQCFYHQQSHWPWM